MSSNNATQRQSLTPRQNEIYEYIRACIQQRHTPPTITEIGARFGIRSTNGVNDLLNALERKGFIIRIRGVSRGIALPDDTPGTGGGTKEKRIPIVGSGDASNPFSIFMNSRGMLTPDPDLLPTSNAFAAVVPDDAMTGDGIFKDDYVIIQQGDLVPPGSLAFALDGDQQVIRRVKMVNGRPVLAASNKYYKQIDINGSGNVVVMGEVVGVLRSLKKDANATD